MNDYSDLIGRWVYLPDGWTGVRANQRIPAVVSDTVGRYAVCQTVDKYIRVPVYNLITG